MLTITSILGNIKRDPHLNQKYAELQKNNLVEYITIHRSESEKVRMRKVTDKGTDVGFTLPSHSHLKDGDIVFLDDTKAIAIKLSPELVAVLDFKKDKQLGNEGNDHGDHQHNYDSREKNPSLINMAIKVGHTIGNLHRPLKIEGENIIFPIQTQEEIGLFIRLLADVKDYVEIHSDRMIFEPDQGFDIHGH